MRIHHPTRMLPPGPATPASGGDDASGRGGGTHRRWAGPVQHRADDALRTRAALRVARCPAKPTSALSGGAPAAGCARQRPLPTARGSVLFFLQGGLSSKAPRGQGPRRPRGGAAAAVRGRGARTGRQSKTVATTVMLQSLRLSRRGPLAEHFSIFLIILRIALVKDIQDCLGKAACRHEHGAWSNIRHAISNHDGQIPSELIKSAVRYLLRSMKI